MKLLLACSLVLFLGLGLSLVDSTLSDDTPAQQVIAKKKKKGNGKRGKKPKVQKIDATVQKRHELHSKDDDKAMEDLVRIGQSAIGAGAGTTTPQAAAANAALEKMRKSGSGLQVPKPKKPAAKKKK